MAKYIEEKIMVLKQLHIFLTDGELAYLENLKTEIAVDNFARSLIFQDRRVG